MNHPHTSKFRLPFFIVSHHPIIVVARKGSLLHRCPACGKVHIFDFDSFVNKAVEQSKRMLKELPGLG